MQAHLVLITLIVTGVLLNKISTTSAGKKKTEDVALRTGNNSVDLTESATLGKTIFMDKCASCHRVKGPSTGPGLAGFEERGPWTERENIYKWVRNPSSFMQNDEYTRNLKDAYGGILMTAFPDLANDEIDAIVNYINESSVPDPGMLLVNN